MPNSEINACIFDPNYLDKKYNQTISNLTDFEKSQKQLIQATAEAESISTVSNVFTGISGAINAPTIALSGGGPQALDSISSL